MRILRINLRTFPRNFRLATTMGVILGMVANGSWVLGEHISRHVQHFIRQEQFASAENEVDPMERLMEILRERERPVSPQWHWFAELDPKTIAYECLEERYADLGEGAGPNGERFLCLSDL